MQMLLQEQAATQTSAPPSIIVTGSDGKPEVLSIPSTGAQLNELYTKRQELNAQLALYSSRRRNLADEMARTVDPAAHAGLQQRLTILDQQLVRLETDIAATNRQITSAAPAVLEESRFQRDAAGNEFADGFAAGSAAVFAVMTILLVLMRRRWKRAARKAPPARVGEDSPRLQRVEQAVDAIAVEVERISEGQRFVTKLLSEATPIAREARLAQSVAADSPKAIG